MKKRILTKSIAVILSLLMMLGSMPILSVSAAQVELPQVGDVYTSNDFSYIITEEGKAELIGYTGDKTAIEIPSIIDDLTVVKVSSYDYGYDTTSFKECTNLISITIPESVESISYGAFEGCINLKNIYVLGKTTNIAGTAFDGTAWYENQPEGVIYIGNTVYGYKGDTQIGELVIKDGIEVICDHAFSDCYAFSSIDLPESVKYIGNYAFSSSGIERIDFFPSGITCIPQGVFSYCYRLKEVNIPYGIKTIEWGAFNECSYLTTVNISSSVTDLNLGAFYECGSLSDINVDEENTVYASEDGSLLNKDKTKLLICPQGKSGDYRIPDSVVNCDEDAFVYCTNITSITIGDYYSGEIRSISGWCRSLERIDVSGGNKKYKSVDGVLFLKDSPELLYCPAAKKGEYMIPSGTEKLSECAFSGSMLSSIVIPSSVKTYGYGVFLECKELNCVVLEEGVTTIGDGAFSSCGKLKSVTLPSTLKTINYNAFSDCHSLEHIQIPDGVETIDTQAFMGCTSLSEINVPENLKNLGSGVFMGTAWYENQPDGVIYIGDFLYEYKGEMPADTNIEIKDGTVEIIKWAFSGQDNLIGVTIPNSVTRIGDGAFRECNGLEKVTIPSSIQNLDDEDYSYGIFSFCDSLKSVIIEESSTSIADVMFWGCPNLKKVVIPDSVKNIGALAFEDCTSLEDILIPEGIEKIGAYAFENTAWYNNQDDGVVYLNTFVYGYKGEMPENTVLKLKDGTTGITEFAFNDCTNLASVTFPNGVKNIGEAAFQGCNNLKTIIIPNTVISIGEFAFNVYADGFVADVYYIGTEEQWKKIEIGSDNRLLANGNTHFVVEHQDKNSGIIVTASDDVELDVENLTNTDEIKNVNIILDNEIVVALYDITLTKDSADVQPDGMVTVKIPTDNENAKVYRVEEDGTLTDMDAVYSDGYMVFATDHFSLYVLAVESSAPSYELGDVNLDGSINIKDATQIQKHLASLVTLEGEAIALADYDGDTKITIKDATAIQKKIAGII